MASSIERPPALPETTVCEASLIELREQHSGTFYELAQSIVTTHHGNEAEIANTLAWWAGLGAAQLSLEHREKWSKDPAHQTGIMDVDFHIAEVLILDQALNPSATNGSWHNALGLLTAALEAQAQKTIGPADPEHLHHKLIEMTLRLSYLHTTYGSDKHRAVIVPYHNNVLHPVTDQLYEEYLRANPDKVEAAVNRQDLSIPGIILGEYVRRSSLYMAELYEKSKAVL